MRRIKALLLLVIVFEMAFLPFPVLGWNNGISSYKTTDSPESGSKDLWKDDFNLSDRTGPQYNSQYDNLGNRLGYDVSLSDHTGSRYDSLGNQDRNWGAWEGNGFGPASVAEGGWNFDRLYEWGEFVYSDENSAELVIGISDTQPESYAELIDLINRHGGEPLSTVSMGGEIGAVIADMPFVAVSSFVAETQAAGLSRYIEPNMKFQTQFVPNDPYWSQQWGPQKIEADWAWNTTIGDPSILVAVIDTGVDYDHPDLAANYVALGYDWVNDDADPMDDHGHGTHVAGIIAAVLNNSEGIAGTAQVSIMAEKGLDQWGSGWEDDLAKAIIHAVNQNADILSNSWGGYYPSMLIHDAIQYAYKNDVLVVAAAGNSATSYKLYPAAYDEVVAVTATDEYDDPAWFTSFGDWVEVAAPGVDIYSTYWDDTYTYMSGTSMATPHVSGVAALIWSQFPNMTRDWVRIQLRYTADDLGEPGFDWYYGYGRVNARRAVEEVIDHDLIILGWERPPYVEPGSLAIINTTILNFGMSDETNVTVQLLVNGTMVNSTVISFLASGASVIVSCSWNTTVEGLYNVTSYVVPVPSENNTWNNVVSAYIAVGFPLKAFVLDSAGTDLYTTTWEILNTNWYEHGDTLIYIDYTTLNIENITYSDIAATDADVLIISCAYAWEFTDSEIAAITQYVLEGHGLIATAGTLYYRVPNNNELAPLFGLSDAVTWDVTGTDLLDILDPTHPLFVDVPDPYTIPYVATAVPSEGIWDSNELIGGTYGALGYYRESAIVVYRGLVYISPWLEVIPFHYYFHLQLLYNAITWTRYQKPEHELVVSLDSPAALKPGESALLNATVSNIGLSNETDVELFLFIDGAEVNSTPIPQLVNGTSYTIRYLWTPTAEATYNVTAYAPPVPGEDNILNNVKSKRVIVSRLLVALFKNVDPWTYPANEEALSFYGIPYVVFSSSDFGAVNLSTFMKVVIAADQDQTFYDAMNTYRWWFEDYVSSGGVLEIHAADRGWHGGGWVGTLPGGLQWVSYYANYVTIVDHTHPVVTTPNLITDAELDGWWWSIHGYFSTYPADSRIVIIEDSTSYPAYLEFDYGAGVIVASSQTLEWAYWRWHSLILENSLLYTPIKYPHELAVTLEAPTFLEPGDSSLLNATVYNRGLSNETDVELFLLINGTIVNNVTIPELMNGTSYTIDYLWTPTLEVTYNVTAYAPPVPDENVTANNIYSAFITVKFAPRILAYVEYTDYSQEYANSLAAIDRTYGPAYLLTELWDYTQLDSMLPGNDILFIPEQEYASLYTMESIGASWSATLSNFMDEGGVIILCDFNGGRGGTYGILTGAGLMSISYSNYITGSIVYLVDPSDPLASGVSSSFVAPNGGISFVTGETNVVFDDGTHPVIIHKIVGSGQIALIGFDYYASNPDADRILGNAVGLVFLDVVPPTVFITNPKPNAMVNSTSVTLEWTGVDNETGIDYFLVYRNTEFAINTTDTSYVLSGLAEGLNNVTVVAYDKAGNFASDQISFTVDPMAPHVVITFPESGYATAKTNITVGWIGSDNETGIAYYLVYLNDTQVLNNTITSHTLTGLDEGDYTIRVDAYDLAGNMDKDEVTIIVDHTAPTVSITAPAEGAKLTGILTIEFTVSDAHLVTALLYIDNGVFNVTGLASFDWNTTSVGDGSHTIRITAIDESGNTNSISISVIVDNTEPTLSMISPENGTMVAGSVTVRFFVFDANLLNVTYSVNGGAPVDITGETSFTIDTTPLADGACSIAITAVDGVEFSVMETLTLVVDNTAPSVSITAPEDEAELSGTATIQFTASDINLDKVFLYIDNAVFNVTGLASFDWNTTSVGDGSHTIRITAIDESGNTKETQVTVITINVQRATGESYVSGRTLGLIIGAVLFSFIGLAIAFVISRRRTVAIKE